MAAGMLAADAAAWRVDAARRSEMLVDEVRATLSEGLRSELIQGALAPLEDRLAALEGAVSASDAAIADGIDRATRTLRRSLEARFVSSCLQFTAICRAASGGAPAPAWSVHRPSVCVLSAPWCRLPQESESALLAGVAAEVVPPLRSMCIQMLNAAAASAPAAADRALPGPVKAEISGAQPHKGRFFLTRFDRSQQRSPSRTLFSCSQTCEAFLCWAGNFLQIRSLKTSSARSGGRCARRRRWRRRRGRPCPPTATGPRPRPPRARCASRRSSGWRSGGGCSASRR